jgi:hypothetical protein
MINILPKRLAFIRNYIYNGAVIASTVAFDRRVFIFLDPSQPSVINTLILLYG